MSVELVKSFTVDKRKLVIKICSASSNVRDYEDRLVYEKWTKKFTTEDEMADYLVGIADEVLGGSIRMNDSMTFKKRINMLKHVDLLEKAGDYVTYYKTVDNPEVKEILLGKKKVEVPHYRIEGDYNKLLINKYSISLTRKRGTKFDDLEVAKGYMERCNNLGWTKMYGLKLVSC